MKLVITNVAPGGPARSITFGGHTYPVLGFAVADGGMTEIYDLECEPAPTVVNVQVQGYFSSRDIAEIIQANRLPTTLPEGR